MCELKWKIVRSIPVSAELVVLELMSTIKIMNLEYLGIIIIIFNEMKKFQARQTL